MGLERKVLGGKKKKERERKERKKRKKKENQVCSTQLLTKTQYLFLGGTAQKLIQF